MAPSAGVELVTTGAVVSAAVVKMTAVVVSRLPARSRSPLAPVPSRVSVNDLPATSVAFGLSVIVRVASS